MSHGTAGMNFAVIWNWSDDATGYGPIFEEEPVDVVYTEDSPDGRISMNCRARSNPPASYRLHHTSSFSLHTLGNILWVSPTVLLADGAVITGKSNWWSSLMSITVWWEETWSSTTPGKRNTPGHTFVWPRTFMEQSSAKRPASSLDVRLLTSQS